MPRDPFEPPYDQFLATAQALAQERPEVDFDIAREVFEEAALLLHNGLVLDDLDEHDGRAVVQTLCVDLIASDPGAAVRARAEATLDAPGELHDPRGVAGVLVYVAALFKL